jgi:hypothetical protein
MPKTIDPELEARARHGAAAHAPIQLGWRRLPRSLSELLSGVVHASPVGAHDSDRLDTSTRRMRSGTARNCGWGLIQWVQTSTLQEDLRCRHSIPTTSVSSRGPSTRAVRSSRRRGQQGRKESAFPGLRVGLVGGRGGCAENLDPDGRVIPDTVPTGLISPATLCLEFQRFGQVHIARATIGPGGIWSASGWVVRLYGMAASGE